jgi:hypothetical protein
VRAKRTAAWLLGGLVLAGGPALAHHSFAMFDGDKVLTLDGTVKEFQWTNPHTWTQLQVTNPQGAVEEWAIEGGSLNALARQGWKRTSLKPGDKISMKIHPLKSGEKGGSFMSATLADGTVLGRNPNAAPAATPQAGQ